MESIPLPSRIHYELLLQLLERQTLMVVKPGTQQCSQVQALIVTLRKALSQHRELEDALERANVPIDYRWSLNADKAELTVTPRPSASSPEVPS